MTEPDLELVRGSAFSGSDYALYRTSQGHRVEVRRTATGATTQTWAPVNNERAGSYPGLMHPVPGSLTYHPTFEAALSTAVPALPLLREDYR